MPKNTKDAKDIAVDAGDANQAISLLTTLLTVVRVFHWQTPSYIAHKESGVLYDALDKSVDEFVECMKGSVLHMSSLHINHDMATVFSQVAEALLSKDVANANGTRKGFSTFLGSWSAQHLQQPTSPIARMCSAHRSSLQSICDDISNAIKRCCYLLAMKD
jgi:hypothetical protein